jgi:hypothetical protein
MDVHLSFDTRTNVQNVFILSEIMYLVISDPQLQKSSFIVR